MHARATPSGQPAVLAGQIVNGPNDPLTALTDLLRNQQPATSNQQPATSNPPSAIRKQPAASDAGRGPQHVASHGISTPSPNEPHLPPGSEAVTIPQVADVTQW